MFVVCTFVNVCLQSSMSTGRWIDNILRIIVGVRMIFPSGNSKRSTFHSPRCQGILQVECLNFFLSPRLTRLGLSDLALYFVPLCLRCYRRPLGRQQALSLAESGLL